MTLSCSVARAADFAANLRRLIARHGFTVDELAGRAEVDQRTLKSLLNGSSKPHARTLHRLANALEEPVDELFQDPSLLVHRLFDRRSNPAVDSVVEEHPEIFQGWTEAEFAELYSRFGHGGGLTSAGALEAAEAMNRRRQLQSKVALLLETGEADLLEQLIELLYQRAVAL